MAPEFFGTIADHLKSEGLTDTEGFKRLVIEKPFGHDLESAKELNNQIRSLFPKTKFTGLTIILGKEMVQNIEVIRFANAIFEPLWNNRFISNIQITSSEMLGVEERGGYYETSGALKGYGPKPYAADGRSACDGATNQLTPEEIRSVKK